MNFLMGYIILKLEIHVILGGHIMIHVVAIIKAKLGKRDAILSVARENVTTVRQEDGCDYIYQCLWSMYWTMGQK